MFYLTTHSTHFIYGYMASDIWLRIILIVRKETHCCHIGYSLRLTARVLLYAPSHRKDSTYHSLCYTSRGALAGTRNSSMDWQQWPHQMVCSCHDTISRFLILNACVFVLGFCNSPCYKWGWIGDNGHIKWSVHVLSESRRRTIVAYCGV